MDKKLEVKNINEGAVRPVWFPVDWQEVIKKRAAKEGLPIYKYLMMLSNNYNIAKKS